MWRFAAFLCLDDGKLRVFGFGTVCWKFEDLPSGSWKLFPIIWHLINKRFNQEKNQQMNQPLVATLELPLCFFLALYIVSMKLLYQPATKKAIMSRVISIAFFRSDHEDFQRWCRHMKRKCPLCLFPFPHTRFFGGFRPHLCLSISSQHFTHYHGIKRVTFKGSEVWLIWLILRANNQTWQLLPLIFCLIGR